MRRHFICIKWFSFGDMDNEHRQDQGKTVIVDFSEGTPIVPCQQFAHTSQQKAERQSHKFKSQKQSDRINGKCLMANVKHLPFASCVIYLFFSLPSFHSILINKIHLCICFFAFFKLIKPLQNIMRKFSNALPVKYEFQWN